MYRWTLRNASRLFSSALCFALCPLLAAQQAGRTEDPARVATAAETIFAYRSSIDLLAELGFDRAQTGKSGSQYGLSVLPFHVPLKLIPVDPAAWANASIGSTVIFRVTSDVVVRGGYADAYAGDLVEAKVIRMREGKIRTRQRITEPRVKEVIVGKYIKLELDSSPEGHQFRRFAKDLFVWSVKGPYMVLLLPIGYAALVIICSTTPCDL